MRLFAIVVGLSCLFFGTAFAKFPEASEDVRAKAVEAALKSQPETVIVYAKGLCCPSCAIGVRKMVSRLPFVDSSDANQGVVLDAKHQLVTVQLRKGTKVNAEQIGKAIDDAGYAPVKLYRYVNGKVVSELLVVKNALWVD